MAFLRSLFYFALLSFQIVLTKTLILILSSFVLIGESTLFFAIRLPRIIFKHFVAFVYALRFLLSSIVRVLGQAVHKIGRFVMRMIMGFVMIPKRIITVLMGTIRRAAIAISTIARNMRSIFVQHINAIHMRLTRVHLPVVSLPRMPHMPRMPSMPKMPTVPRLHISVTMPKVHIVLPHWSMNRVLRNVAVVTSLCVVGGVIGYFGFVFFSSLPKPQDIGTVNYALTTHVYDRNGKKLFDFYKDQNRTPVNIDELPPHVLQATIAIEDKDFYNHHGIAPISGIARALRDWLIRKRGIQGGSTITQQLVKTALLSSERTFERKIKEVIIALETERVFSKKQILEMYLNQVPYGGPVYGIQEASKRYFGKEAKDLTISEAALLAGLPQAPSDYSPFTNHDAAISRRNQVLLAMLEQGYISRVQYVLARRDNLTFSTDSVSIAAPHFVFFTKKFLQTTNPQANIDQNGFSVYTTLDLNVQNEVEKILLEELFKIQNLQVSNGAVLVTKPATGEIIAMVGSKNFFDTATGAFNVTTALRQPGSSIKPILYALAMQKGVTAATIIDDTPTVYRIGPTEVYRPVNYDGRFHGRVTVRSALANSYNIPAVKLIDRVGVSEFMAFAKDAGIDTWSDPSNYGISLALGGGEVTMTDMAEAFSMLANYGRRTNVNPVLMTISKDGEVSKNTTTESQQIVSHDIAYIMSDILSDNQARVPAFGSRSALEVPGYQVAVKTGTTDEKRDNWTIGYTPDYMVVVWVGNNDHTPMNPYLTSGITGAAPIWNRVMTYLLTEYSAGQKNWFTRPGTLVEKNCLGRKETFVPGTEDSVNCVIPTPQKTAENKDKSPDKP